MSNLPESLLNERQAAQLLGWSVSALQQRRFRGQEPRYLKLGGRSVRYELDALKEFIEKSRISAGNGEV
jgi:predicted DNA-binding transcriptional regulator AlpA